MIRHCDSFIHSFLSLNQTFWTRMRILTDLEFWPVTLGTLGVVVATDLLPRLLQ